MIGPGKDGMTDEQKEELDEASNACHEHSNKNTLDSTTASFTTSMKTVVNNLISGIVSTYLKVSSYLTVASYATIAGYLTVASYFTVSGYSKFGSDAPSIKMKKISGTSPGLSGTSYFETGLTKDQIISFSVQISDNNGDWKHSDFGGATEDSSYYAYVKSDGRLVLSIFSTSTSVYACVFDAIFFYEES